MQRPRVLHARIYQTLHKAHIAGYIADVAETATLFLASMVSIFQHRYWSKIICVIINNIMNVSFVYLGYWMLGNSFHVN